MRVAPREAISSARPGGLARTWEFRSQISDLALRDPDDLERVLDTAIRNGVDGLVIFQDALTLPLRQRIVDDARRRWLPSIVEAGGWARAGGLLSYGPSAAGQARQCASFIARILKGESPADLPIQQPTELDFLINLTTAQAFGLTIPHSVLVQATELIQ
ncbi:MAG: ABC transporter substrate binding protein [Chloroflexota bacterium]